MEERTKIKLCGMMNPPDVITAMELGVDYVGFILSEGFRRTIPLGTFCELNSYLAGSGVKKVGVFVNEPIEGIMEYYEESLDVIQLHGQEDALYIKTLRQHTKKPIIKAFKITSAEDVQMANKSTADYVLLDSGTGTGKTFDHSLIEGINRPYFLAGGLTAQNVKEAILKLHPYAVDASSCLETDGRKDKNKMTEFVNAIRS
ncbi:MAG: phosphoribosylanthranilate isomerase [Lachnospiraceae bacterium]|nr:phosphoribosylanthranilate isomerase [Lachnospiraceae bacterium]